MRTSNFKQYSNTLLFHLSSYQRPNQLFSFISPIPHPNSRAQNTSLLCVSSHPRPTFSCLSNITIQTTEMSSSLVQRPSKSSTRRLVDFYDPSTKDADAEGRTLDGILGWDDDLLEAHHSYIQTIFPLPEASGFGHSAPIIDEETMLIFRNSPELKSSLLRALERMLAFYGFNLEVRDPSGSTNAPQVTISPKENTEENFARWLRRIDHNHLRITRIIRSLRVLGLEDAARAFFEALIDVIRTYGRVGSSSIGFWTRALNAPLRQAPDGTVVAWLEKY
ncbi:opioid growth factor receptor conserved region-domain-containing protein [Xylariaceae sp. FL1651]|nr:opioid growth factor receptor conserved region-domain-containing protein [Xylariaceae sp. FL1651]